jgi:hypothetical protein
LRTEELAARAAEQAIAQRDPARQLAQARHLLQLIELLAQLEVFEILADHLRHAHAQSRRNVLQRHFHLMFRVFENGKQTLG